jgi:hypothetical protein
MKYGIDPFVWEKIIGVTGDASLPRVMLAACITPKFTESKIFPPYNLADAITMCIRHNPISSESETMAIGKILSTLSEWIKDQKDPRSAIKILADWDNQLAIWCAASCADSALRFMPASEVRPILSIAAVDEFLSGYDIDDDDAVNERLRDLAISVDFKIDKNDISYENQASMSAFYVVKALLDAFGFTGRVKKLVLSERLSESSISILLSKSIEAAAIANSYADEYFAERQRFMETAQEEDVFDEEYYQSMMPDTFEASKEAFRNALAQLRMVMADALFSYPIHMRRGEYPYPDSSFMQRVQGQYSSVVKARQRPRPYDEFSDRPRRRR